MVVRKLPQASKLWPISYFILAVFYLIFLFILWCHLPEIWEKSLHAHQNQILLGTVHVFQCARGSKGSSLDNWKELGVFLPGWKGLLADLSKPLSILLNSKHHLLLFWLGHLRVLLLSENLSVPVKFSENWVGKAYLSRMFFEDLLKLGNFFFRIFWMIFHFLPCTWWKNRIIRSSYRAGQRNLNKNKALEFEIFRPEELRLPMQPGAAKVPASRLTMLPGYPIYENYIL